MHMLRHDERMVARLILALCALMLPASALAQNLEGAWALQIDEATIFRFELEQVDGTEWRGTWTRPDSFGSNGVVFSQLRGSEQLRSMAGNDFAGVIELSFDDPRPGAIPDIFRFRQLDANRAELIYVGTPFAPYPLIRVAPGTPLGPFEEGRIYDRDNAVTEADFAEPLPPLEEVEPPAESEEEQEEGERPRIDADFLDDLQP